MQDNEKISIIIVTHNNSATIEKALRSVCTGIRPANQVVVADNDSGDGTYDLLCRLLKADPVELDGKTGLPPKFTGTIDNIPITIFRKQKSTVAHSLNIGLQMSNRDTTIFGFCDPTSWYAPDKIAQAVCIFQQHSVVACVVSDCDHYFSDGRVERQFKPSFDIRKLFISFPYDKNFIVRAQVFNKLRAGFTEQLQLREEYDLLLRITEIGLIYHIPAPLHNNTIEYNEIDKQLILQSEHFIRQAIARRKQEKHPNG